MQVERTLVKSSPELWAEVSEVESLARHLAEFGEITITRVEPETTVAWEGEHASGTVELSASGWGTKVTLTAAVAEIEAEPVPAADPLPAAAAEPVPEPVAEPVAEPLPPAAVEPVAAGIEGERAASPADSAPPHDDAPSLSSSKRSWLRFWKRPAELAEPTHAEPDIEPEPEPEPVAIDPGPPVPTPDPAPPTPTPDPGPAPAPDPSPPQIRFDPDRTEAVLTQVLDDLGQAHHRPYSRS
jgi:hypothetical protein